MVIVETSAWIEFLRGTNSEVCDRTEHLLREDQVAMCDPVRMEVLAGARDLGDVRRLEALLARSTLLETKPGHFNLAAALHRTCRKQGDTIRSMVDCLIAALALDANLPVLHADRDFEVIARHTGLRLA